MQLKTAQVCVVIEVIIGIPLPTRNTIITLYYTKGTLLFVELIIVFPLCSHAVCWLKSGCVQTIRTHTCAVLSCMHPPPQKWLCSNNQNTTGTLLLHLLAHNAIPINTSTNNSVPFVQYKVIIGNGMPIITSITTHTCAVLSCMHPPPHMTCITSITTHTCAVLSCTARAPSLVLSSIALYIESSELN